MDMSSIVRAVKERNEEFEGGEEDSEIDGSAMFKSPEQKSIDHLLSDYVIELLESLEIPEEQINELKAEMVPISTLEQPEELMVHMSSIAANIIKGEPVTQAMLEPKREEVRLQAAKMSLCFLALLSWTI